jgi:predicted RNA-binding protein with TRAM domain
VLAGSDVGITHPVGEGEWYAVLRKAVTELGEGAEAVEGIFGATAAKVYDIAD